MDRVLLRLQIYLLAKSILHTYNKPNLKEAIRYIEKYHVGINNIDYVYENDLPRLHKRRR